MVPNGEFLAIFAFYIFSELRAAHVGPAF